MSTLANAYVDSEHRHAVPPGGGRGAAGGGGGAPTAKPALPNWLDYVVTLLPAEVLALYTASGTDFFNKLQMKGNEKHFWLFGIAAAVFYVAGRVGTKGYKSLLDAIGKRGGDLEKEHLGVVMEAVRIVIPAIAMWPWLLLGETSQGKAPFNDDRVFLYGLIALIIAAALKYLTDHLGWKATP